MLLHLSSHLRGANKQSSWEMLGLISRVASADRGERHLLEYAKRLTVAMDPQFTCMSFKKEGDATIAIARSPCDRTM